MEIWSEENATDNADQKQPSTVEEVLSHPHLHRATGPSQAPE